MTKEITLTKFQQVARKFEEGGEVLSKVFEHGHTIIPVAEHTFCRVEKKGEIVKLRVNRKRGYKENQEEMVIQNPFIKELVDNCDN